MKIRVFSGKIVFVVAILLIVGNCAYSVGSITGFGRFEKIAGNPAMGYKELYEWDLFLSPADNSIVGPYRRLGAPPGQVARGDGYYRIDNLPAGEYSLYVNQPDFFASPKIVPNVQINNGEVTTVNVELDVDYSTYFRDTGGEQWTEWLWTWYQTFEATGTSVRGVSWMMAGWGQYRDKRAEISIVEDNGNGDVRTWPVIGSGSDGQLSSDSDEWVRWPSGQIKLVPGQKYAVKIWVDGGCAVYKRDKDGNSYALGRAYDQDGNAKNYDLNATVFVDKNDQSVTHTRLSSGPGDFDGGLNSTRWGQTFVATGGSLAAVDVFAASGMADTKLTWTIRQGGPGGGQIGPTKTTLGAYYASSTDLIGVSYNDGDVPLVPGQTYYIDAYAASGFTPYTQPSWNAYSDGIAYKNGSVTGYDLAMTIMEYSKGQEPRSLDLNGNGWIEFWDFAMLAEQWGGTGAELAADFDYSGVVDAADLDELFDSWLGDFRVMAHWKLDEKRGSIAYDSIGANDGTLHGYPQWLASGGKLGGALEMDGTDDYVSTDFVLNPGDGPFSVFAWVKGGGAEAVVLSQSDSGGEDRDWLAADSGGNLVTYVIRPGRGAAPLISEAIITDGLWHRIGLVCDGSYRLLYCDGVEVAADSSALAGIIGVDGGLHIGADSGLSAASFWGGLVDDVRIYGQAVSP